MLALSVSKAYDVAQEQEQKSFATLTRSLIVNYISTQLNLERRDGVN